MCTIPSKRTILQTCGGGEILAGPLPHLNPDSASEVCELHDGTQTHTQAYYKQRT